MFGFDEKLVVRHSFRFSQNNLVISSVDIQSVEPVDQRTRDALQKSVQLAIEITTNSQEAAARSDHTESLRRYLMQHLNIFRSITSQHVFMFS